MTKIEITKKIASKAASMSTSLTVSALITANTPVKHPYQKVIVFIGAYCIAGLLEKPVENYVCEQIDEIVESVNNAKASYNAA